MEGLTKVEENQNIPIRQHFLDFYGDLTPEELERLMYAERLVLRDLQERWHRRRWLRSLGEEVAEAAATSFSYPPQLVLP